jgi:hypothetical protein
MKVSRIFRDRVRRSVALMVDDNMRQETRRHSRHLAEAYDYQEIRRGTRDTLRVRNLYYWAGYLDKGVDRVVPKNGYFLVWFRNREDDPRRPNGPVMNRSQERKLTAAEWTYWNARNRDAIAAGQEPPMIVARSTGPMSRYSRPGFRIGKNFVAKARQEIQLEMPRLVSQELQLSVAERLRAFGKRSIVVRV